MDEFPDTSLLTPQREWPVFSARRRSAVRSSKVDKLPGASAMRLDRPTGDRTAASRWIPQLLPQTPGWCRRRVSSYDLLMSPARAPGGRLLDRAAELGVITAALESARSGSGSALLVEGTAGIGKTALLSRSCEQAALAGVTCWRRGRRSSRVATRGGGSAAVRARVAGRRRAPVGGRRRRAGGSGAGPRHAPGR